MPAKSWPLGADPPKPADHNPKKYFSEPCSQAFRAFFALRGTRIQRSRLLLLDCKGSFRTVSFPMENCRRRQSSLVSVLLPHWRLRKRGDSAAGIDSWQRVVKQRYLVSPSRFETPRSAPVTGDRAVAIFQSFDGPRGRGVANSRQSRARQQATRITRCQTNRARL